MDPFVGQIQAFGFNFAPRGWAQCNGQLMSIAENNALFSLLGTYYGGDGRTTFGLPDLRGRFGMHMGNGPGLPAHQIGQKGGRNELYMTTANMPAHTHSLAGGTVNVPISTEDANASEGEGNYLANGTFYHNASSASYTGTSLGGNTSMAGGNIPMDITPPFQVINYCIALVGIYPSRN